MNRAENTLQRQIWQLFQQTKRVGVLGWCANNNPRSARDGARLQRMGMRAGVGDLLFLAGGKFYSLELKTEKGRASEEQLAWRDCVNQCGGFAAIAHGFESAVSILRMWGLVK